jgi:hypothetical protein
MYPVVARHKERIVIPAVLERLTYFRSLDAGP